MGGDARKDLEKKMKIQNWSKMSMDREAWKKLLGRPKLKKNYRAKRRKRRTTKYKRWREIKKLSL
jgi:1,2-phenylacetyl-CoA epoxidase PaaB subunit